MSERHKPLFFHWEHRPFFHDLRQSFGCDETGAAILLSLYYASGPVSYSRNKNNYSGLPRYKVDLFSHHKVTKAVDTLASWGVIVNHIMPPGSLGWQSYMELTEESRIKIGQIVGDNFIPRTPVETIILRDAAKNLCGYCDTAESRAMRRNLIPINEALTSCHLGGCWPCPFYRIFNQNFARGGRFYSAGGWQNMPQHMRAGLKINGAEVIEIDYKALHPSLIYCQAGLHVPADAYDIHPWPRSLVKRAFLILLNARSYHSALSAIAHSDEMKSFTQPGPPNALEKARALIADIKNRHSAIERAFHNDSGAALMRTDSDLAEAVLMILHKLGLVALPVHDSFLIDRKHADDLEDAMHHAATKFGFPNLRTDRKQCPSGGAVH